MTRRVGTPIPHRGTPGSCRWCGDPILRPDGQPDRRRTWHPDCVTAYQLAAGWPDVIRRIAWRQDQGVCRACGHDLLAARLRVVGQAMWRRIRLLEGVPSIPHWWVPEVRDSGSCRGVTFPPCTRWHADHRVPLADGGTHDAPNLQVLCVPCHKAKTALEATTRAARRRGVAA